MHKQNEKFMKTILYDISDEYYMIYLTSI